MKRFGLIAAGVIGMPMAALAQVEELPAYAYDAFTQVGFATTASTECPGADMNNASVKKAMAKVMGQLVADGIDPVAAVKHLETDAGLAQINAREIAFRARHGVGETGYEALCAAIKAETKENKAFRKLVRLR